MPGPSWTEPRHALWLAEKLSQYHDAQKRNSVGRFLKATYEAWFRAFPLRVEVFPNKPLTELLTPAETKRLEGLLAVRKKQIKSWFTWRRLRLGRRGGNPAGRRSGPRSSGSSAADELAQLLNIDIEKKEGRAPQRIEVYQILYHARIVDAINQELLLNPPPAGLSNTAALLTVRRRVTKRMLDSESPAVNQQIDAYIADWKRNKQAPEAPPSNEDDDFEAEDTKPTPEEMQKVISMLPELMEKFFGPCSRATGWTFFVMGAGPTPGMGGKVYMEQYNFGPKSPAGNTFNEAYVDFKQNVSTPFCKYAMGVFSPDICAASALKTHQTDAERVANAASDHPPMSSTTTPHTSSTSTAASASSDAANASSNAAGTTAASVASTFSDASSTISGTTIGTVSVTAAGASATGSGVVSTNDSIGARLDHSINAIPMISDNNTGADQRESLNTPGGPGTPASVGPLNAQAAGELGGRGGGGLLDWERELLASMGDIDHADLFSMDYTDSAFTDLPNPSMLGTSHVNAPSLAPELPVVQPPIPDLAQAGVYVDGFLFPNNDVISFGQPARFPVRVEPRVTADVNDRVPGTDPTSAMGDISNKVTQPKKGRASNNKRKAQPDVVTLGEPENIRRTKRKIVAPARRDKTPELASGLHKKVLAM